MRTHTHTHTHTHTQNMQRNTSTSSTTQSNTNAVHACVAMISTCAQSSTNRPNTHTPTDTQTDRDISLSMNTESHVPHWEAAHINIALWFAGTYPHHNTSSFTQCRRYLHVHVLYMYLDTMNVLYRIHNLLYKKCLILQTIEPQLYIVIIYMYLHVHVYTYTCNDCFNEMRREEEKQE